MSRAWKFGQVAKESPAPKIRSALREERHESFGRRKHPSPEGHQLRRGLPWKRPMEGRRYSPWSSTGSEAPFQAEQQRLACSGPLAQDDRWRVISAQRLLNRLDALAGKSRSDNCSLRIQKSADCSDHFWPVKLQCSKGLFG